MKVYLAGPITGLTWEECTVWRNKVVAELKLFDIQCFSPLRAKKYIADTLGVNGNVKVADSYPEFVLSSPKGITTRDRYDATRCDVLFVNFLGVKRISIGTVLEIAWADSKRIPIIIVMEKDNPHQHSMITECAGFIVPTVKEGIDIVKAILMVE